MREAVRREARDAIVQHWSRDLASVVFGRRTLDAIGPVLKDWLVPLLPSDAGTLRSVGGNLSLPAVVRGMVGSEEAWAAMASFCEVVMSQKEAAEHEREEDPLAAALRRRRRGNRRRDFAHFLPPLGERRA